MYGKSSSSFIRKAAISVAALTLSLCATSVALADEPAPDESLAGWIGREFTIQSSTIDDQMPTGGKLTFVFDGAAETVRVCTRDTSEAKGKWRMDFANPCSVTMTFTHGTRYCTLEDIKTGDAELLAQCHRLRSHDVVMRPSKDAKGVVELNDMMVFLVKGANGKRVISVLVDSPSRLTGGGVVVGQG